MRSRRVARGTFVYVCAVAVLSGAATRAEPSVRPLHLLLAFEAGSPAPPSIRDNAVREAADVWSRYGIIVDAEQQTVCTADTMKLLVAVDLQSDDDESDILGSVRFAPDGTPDFKVTLHYRAIMKLATS